ncbi:hypothetical protein NQZ79_g104 [Umbelopsis isabellina]|nr:hypothetical protein NQZ79_g104 [Umbelopsis isabellina]
MPGAIDTHALHTQHSATIGCECSTASVPHDIFNIMTLVAQSIQDTYSKMIETHCQILDQNQLSFSIFSNKQMVEQWILNVDSFRCDGMLELGRLQTKIFEFRPRLPDQHLYGTIHTHMAQCAALQEYVHVQIPVHSLSAVSQNLDLTHETVTRAIPIDLGATLPNNLFQLKASSLPDSLLGGARTVSRRRLSCLSMSALQDEDPDFTGEEHVHRATLCRNKQLQYTWTHHRHNMFSSSPPADDTNIPPPPITRRKSTIEPLVGSFEECLLNNRMSTKPTTSIQFNATIHAVARGSGKKRENFRTSGPIALDFEAHMYELDGKPLPYAGTIDVHAQHRIPPKGQLQILIVHGERGAVKVFIVPYDLRDMAANHSTFLRRREYVTPENGSKTLKYAIHIPVKSSKHRHLHLHGPIRVVFSNQANNANDRVEIKMEHNL